MLGTLLSGIGEGASNAFGTGSNIIGAVGQRIGTEKAINRQKDGLTSADKKLQELYDQIASQYDPYTEGGLSKYNELLELAGQTIDPGQYTADNAREWLDPSMDYQRDQSQKALGTRSQGAGTYLSSGAMQDMMEANRLQAETGFNEARDFGYQKYRDDIATNQGILDNKRQSLQNIVDMGTSARDTMTGVGSQIKGQQIQFGLDRAGLDASKAAGKAGMWTTLAQQPMQLGQADSKVFANKIAPMLGGSKGGGMV